MTDPILLENTQISGWNGIEARIVGKGAHPAGWFGEQLRSSCKGKGIQGLHNTPKERFA